MSPHLTIRCANCHSSYLFSLVLRPPHSPLFPYTTLFRSTSRAAARAPAPRSVCSGADSGRGGAHRAHGHRPDRKSTRLNSSHLVISYAVFCLKKKKQQREEFCTETTS